MYANIDNTYYMCYTVLKTTNSDLTGGHYGKANKKAGS